MGQKCFWAAMLAMLSVFYSIEAMQCQEPSQSVWVCERPYEPCFSYQNDCTTWGGHIDLALFRFCQNGPVSFIAPKSGDDDSSDVAGESAIRALKHDLSVGVQLGIWWRPACSTWRYGLDAAVYSSSADQEISGNPYGYSVLNVDVDSSSEPLKITTRDVVDLRYFDFTAQKDPFCVLNEIGLSILTGARFVSFDRSFQGFGSVANSSTYDKETWRQSTFAAGLMIGFSLVQNFCSWQTFIDGKWATLVASTDYSNHDDDDGDLLSTIYIKKACHPIYVADIGVRLARSFCLCEKEVLFDIGFNFEYWNGLSRLKDLNEEQSTNSTEAFMVTALHCGIGMAF